MTAAQAVALDRVRIARELHDVVAHHVSAMGVQAGAARAVMERDPDAARTALLGIEASARSALDELHQLLETLRTTAARHRRRLDGAAVGARRAGRARPDNGLPTTLTVVGDRVELPDLVQVNIYRVAQEALTNARRHGGPDAAADVRLRYGADDLELEVANDRARGRGRRCGPASGSSGCASARRRRAARSRSVPAGAAASWCGCGCRSPAGAVRRTGRRERRGRVDAGDAIRVLLVDDHAVMRAGFRMILESADDIAVVGEAATGVEAVAAASALRPDVICMDVQMPDMDGLEATRRIVARRRAVDAAVVIVTTFDRDDYLFQALAAGASGFLLKNAGPEELIAAVRVAAAGDALLAPEVTRRVIARFAQSATAPPAASVNSSDGAEGGRTARQRPTQRRPEQSALVAAPVVELTDREAEVLRLVAQAMSNAEIAQRLYIGEATVKTHVSNVLQKLGARDRVAAVVYAHRHGLTTGP